MFTRKQLDIRFEWLVVVFLVAVSGCKRENITRTIDISVRQYGNLPEPESFPRTVISEQPITNRENGIIFNCDTKTYRFGESLDEIAIMRPYADVMYPGSLLQGRNLQAGGLDPIGSTPRSVMTLTIDGLGLSEHITPSKSNVEAAIQSMLGRYTGTPQANFIYKSTVVHTMDQATMDLGIDYRWARNSLGFSRASGTTARKSVMMVSFKQAFYSVSVNPPSSPGQLFPANVDPSILDGKIGEGNPLCYISSVTYGRMILVKIESDENIESLQNAVQATFGNLGGQIRFSDNRVISSASIEAIVVGGGALRALNAVTSQNIRELILQDSEFSRQNTGVPISYAVRHASDLSLVRSGSAVTYTENASCTADPQTYVPIKFAIHNFHILQDCDNGAFVNTGPGEFSWEVRFKHNGQELRAPIRSGSIVDRNDGDYIYINYPDQVVPMPREAGHTLEISIHLWEHDGSDVDYLPFTPIQSRHPYDNIDSDQRAQFLEYTLRPQCAARVYFSVWKP